MDETFILMCREAKEIQDQWKPKDGDYVTYWQEFANKRVPSAFEYLQKDYDGVIIDDIGHPIKNCGNVVWLPRQEDLQKIYFQHFNLHDEMVVLYHFKQWENSLKAIIQKLFPTITITWLSFVMGTCYNKQWNGETGKWEVI